MKRAFLFTLIGIAIFGFVGVVSILFADYPLAGFGVCLVVGSMGATYPGFWEE